MHIQSTEYPERVMQIKRADPILGSFDAVGNRLSQIVCVSVGNCVTINYTFRLLLRLRSRFACSSGQALRRRQSAKDTNT